MEVNGLKLPNPFVIGSGPPGTNYQVMKKAFDEGWGGVICKTLSLDSSKVRWHGQYACTCAVRDWQCLALPCSHTQVANIPAAQAAPASQYTTVHHRGWVGIPMLASGCQLLVTDRRCCCWPRPTPQVVNVTPRYAKLLDSKGEVFGWENFELISGETPAGAVRMEAGRSCSSSLRLQQLVNLSSSNYSLPAAVSSWDVPPAATSG